MNLQYLNFFHVAEKKNLFFSGKIKDNGILQTLSACGWYNLSQKGDAGLKSYVEKPERFQPIEGWFTYFHIISPNDTATVMKKAPWNAHKKNTDMQAGKLHHKMFYPEV